LEKANKAFSIRLAIRWRLLSTAKHSLDDNKNTLFDAKTKLTLDKFLWKRLPAAAFDLVAASRSHIPLTFSFDRTE